MKTIDVLGNRFNVFDEGTGAPLLFVHGFPLNHTMWRHQLAFFAAKYRVIAPDLRGFGQGAVTPGTVTMQQHADDLAALLDALEVREPVHFCALSMGGYVGWQFWLHHARRLKSLVLCDTRAVADTPEAARGRQALVEKVLRDGPAPAVEAMLPKLLAADVPASRPELVDEVRAMIESTAPEGIAAALRGMAARPDVTAELAKVRLPALCIVGQRDVISTPEEMRGIAAAIPNCQFVEIPAAGHMCPLEAPEAFNDALAAFLASV